MVCRGALATREMATAAAAEAAAAVMEQMLSKGHVLKARLKEAAAAE